MKALRIINCCCITWCFDSCPNWIAASDPVCSSNLSFQNNIAAELDTVWIQCDLNYTGRWFPTMEWLKQIQNISYASTTVPNNFSNVQNTFSSVIMQVDADDNGAVINFKTYFASSGNQVTTNASNIPDYVYNWNITINVECEFLQFILFY